MKWREKKAKPCIRLPCVHYHVFFFFFFKILWDFWAKMELTLHSNESYQPAIRFGFIQWNQCDEKGRRLCKIFQIWSFNYIFEIRISMIMIKWVIKGSIVLFRINLMRLICIYEIVQFEHCNNEHNEEQ